MKNNKTLKTIVFSLGLAVMTLSANNLNAQSRHGGLFGNHQPANSELMEDHGGLMGDRGTSGINVVGISNADFGEEAPLGSGIAIMLAAGLGYVALKKKED